MESVIRGVAVYLILLVIIRLSGRRTMAQTTPFDFVLLLIIAETTQQALLAEDFSITNAVLLITTLFVLDIGLSYVTQWFPGVGKVITGRPTFLMVDGEFDERAIKKSRIEKAAIMTSAREQHGLERYDQIKHAVLETDAGITVIPKEK